ncbi:hypothetical protein KI387_017666 [Taxus chinensis]|uniref:Hexosyltransferase n=1 Tax=Taxus chinensis TaxID=29808 RepID=A0AA38GJ22_TAXCH|nr:hypothetical protein KI387_017666 [Taxus chinensis]
MVTSPSSFYREMQYINNGNSFNGLNSSSSPFLLRTDENTYVGTQATQIFINCTCPHRVQNCTEDEEKVMAAIADDSKPDDRFSILIGILTRADLYERRHFLRMVYGIQSTVHARVDVKFVFCNLTKDDQRMLVPLEIMRYNDIIILNCEENMNNGKTYTYFSSLSKMGLHYDYVMKADDDVYFRIDKLAESLKPLPRNDTYYGFVIPCQSNDCFGNHPFKSYMSGMGYALSWDLVEWIEGSPVAKNKSEGVEDKMVGLWLDEGKKAKNRFNNKPAMYDFPLVNGKCSHELIPDTIAVHKLKDRKQWFDVLNFFNVTSALNESKFYHLY